MHMLFTWHKHGKVGSLQDGYQKQWFGEWMWSFISCIVKSQLTYLHPFPQIRFSINLICNKKIKTIEFYENSKKKKKDFILYLIQTIPFCLLKIVLAWLSFIVLKLCINLSIEKKKGSYVVYSCICMSKLVSGWMCHV